VSAAAPARSRPTIDEIVRDHLPLVTRCVSRTLGAHYVAADVEDVVVDALFEVHRALPRYDLTRRIQGWLYRIAQRTAVDHRRKGRRARRAVRLVDAETIGPEGIEAIADGALNPEDLMGRHELRLLLDAFLAGLPEEERDVLDMRLCGMTAGDMAEALDVPIGTVSLRVRRAEAALSAVADRHQRARRDRARGVVVLPLMISEVMERVGADLQDVPAGMRERVEDRLRERMTAVPMAPRLAAPAAGGAGVGGLVVGLVGVIAALVAVVLFLLAPRRPGPSASSDAATGAPASALVAPASLPAASMAAPAASCVSPSTPEVSAPGSAAAAPAVAHLGPSPAASSPSAQRRALLRAFNRAMAARDYREACAKLQDYDAHHFTDVGAATDRAAMSRQARDAGVCDQK
jgi:RNA polymerase sigma factor (sigma-70 family)